MRTDVMKALKRKDVEIQKLRDMCDRQREKIMELEAKIRRLKK